MGAAVEINKKKEEIKSGMNEEFLETEASQKLLRGSMTNQAKLKTQEADLFLQNLQKDLEREKKKT